MLRTVREETIDGLTLRLLTDGKEFTAVTFVPKRGKIEMRGADKESCGTAFSAKL